MPDLSRVSGLIGEVVTVDPISIGLLMATASGAGGAAGQQAWQGLGALVRRPFERHSDAEAESAAHSGLDEWAKLQRAPSDREAAFALAVALQARAAEEAGFRAALQTWLAETQATQQPTIETVSNVVSGGNQYGAIMQGGTFTGITVTHQSPSTPPAEDPRPQ